MSDRLALRSFAYFRGARVTFVTGKGVRECPMREVTCWFDEDGNLIGHNDQWSRDGWASMADMPGWALVRVSDVLEGQQHNPAIHKVLNAISAEHQRRDLPREDSNPASSQESA